MPRRSARATREQLGAANAPDQHQSTSTPAGVDGKADEFPAADQPLVRSPAERMRWRGPQGVAPAPGPATMGGGEYGQSGSAHAVPGRPDPRRLWGASTPAGGALGPAGAAPPIGPEVFANVRVPEPVAPIAAPYRHRGGPTSDDPARPAVLALAVTMRPFDKWAPERFAALDKIEMDSPRASAPTTLASDVPGREPSAGGGYAMPGMGPFVGASPNTYRLMPRGWDELLVVTGLTGAGLPGSADTGRRAGGWRTRG